MTFPQMPDPSQNRSQTDAALQASGQVSAQADKAASHISGLEKAAKSKDSSDQSDAGTSGKREPTPYYELRLTMDKNPKTGEWVYKAIDRATGEVVKELPRQSLIDMQNSSNYTAGSVIKTDV